MAWSRLEWPGVAWSDLEWVGAAWIGLKWVGAQFDKSHKKQFSTILKEFQ